MSDYMRPATDEETADYLNGYRSFAGAIETEHGLLVEAQRPPAWNGRI